MWFYIQMALPLLTVGLAAAICVTVTSFIARDRLNYQMEGIPGSRSATIVTVLVLSASFTTQRHTRTRATTSKRMRLLPMPHIGN
jgi:hypothetical protein